MANLVPDNIRRSVDRFRDNLMDVAERFIPERRTRISRSEESWVPSVFTRGMPVIDIVENDEDIRVTAELPGVDKDDFKVELMGKRLILQGEKKSSREERDRDYFYAERSYGSFSRSVELPCEVDPERARATFKNGELKLTLPKTEEARARRIKVNIDEPGGNAGFTGTSE